MTPKPLFEQVGKENIQSIIGTFYDRAFVDPIIGHFFWGKDKAHLIAAQIAFTLRLLGDRSQVIQVDLKAVHAPMQIRPAHFGRRQILMGEVLAEFKLPELLIRQWLTLEEQFRPLLVK